MKTLTEFDSQKISQVLKRLAELTAEAKTPEEQKTLIGEALKVEGEKLDRLLAAAEVAKKRPEYLKRVLVMQLNEGEKAPQHAVQVAELHYVCEYFPQPESKRPPKKDFKGGPRGKGKGKGKGRGGRGDRGGRGGRPGEGDRNASGAPGGDRSGRPEGAAGPDGEKKRRFRPRRRGPGGNGQGQGAGRPGGAQGGGAGASAPSKAAPAAAAVSTAAPAASGESSS